MTDSKELRALIAAATPGPWKEIPGCDELFGSNGIEDVSVCVPIGDTPEGAAANAALIVAAVNNLEPLLSTNEALERENAEKDAVIAHLQQSLAEQALARADPTMPRLMPAIIEQLRGEAEAAYALAETRKDRVMAHGLSLLCDWQDRLALEPSHDK